MKTDAIKHDIQKDSLQDQEWKSIKFEVAAVANTVFDKNRKLEKTTTNRVIRQRLVIIIEWLKYIETMFLQNFQFITCLYSLTLNRSSEVRRTSDMYRF